MLCVCINGYSPLVLIGFLGCSFPRGDWQEVHQWDGGHLRWLLSHCWIHSVRLYCYFILFLFIFSFVIDLLFVLSLSCAVTLYVNELQHRINQHEFLLKAL